MLDPAVIDQKAAKLQEIATILKKEFFGMDEIIDRVLFNIEPWFTFPQLLLRPVIINLWGLTGVGKTDLVRRLVHLLGFGDRFVELQMDGISSDNGAWEKTISGLLSRSSIEEGQPGILLLDEFQRYRTVGMDGSDIKVERFQDVWMLLSDGKFPADSSLFRELESTIANAFWHQENLVETRKADVPESEGVQKKRSVLYPYEALRFKKLLKLTIPVIEIMQMPPERLMAMINQALEDRTNNQLDYTKLLVFVSGNLDEAYHAVTSTEDCDTDADVFHKRTLGINVVDIKKSLTERFKPEQVARFGNNHIIYPSLTKITYQKLIERTCTSYTATLEKITGIRYTLDRASLDVIYANSVYPAQGTRPVFTSVYTIFSCALARSSLWALKRGLKSVQLAIDDKRSMLVARSPETDEKHETEISLDLDTVRARTSEEYKMVVAVHEAGHALIHALLFKTAPEEVKINASSFAAGFVIQPIELEIKATSRRDIKHQLAVLYAGRCAEAFVFGPENITLGAESDIMNATKLAVQYVRTSALDGVPGAQMALDPGRYVRALLPSLSDDEPIKALLEEAKERASQELVQNKPLFVKLVNALIAGETLNKQRFTEMFPELCLKPEPVYTDLWRKFSS